MDMDPQDDDGPDEYIVMAWVVTACMVGALVLIILT